MQYLPLSAAQPLRPPKQLMGAGHPFPPVSTWVCHPTQAGQDMAGQEAGTGTAPSTRHVDGADSDIILRK